MLALGFYSGSQTYNWKKGDFPNAEWIGERTLSLPLSAALTDDDVEDVVKAFRKILARSNIVVNN